MPASRTPEGDSIECTICGARSIIDISTPAGDCVCPVCGALNWFAPSLLDYVDRRDNESAKQVIRRYVKELDSRMKDCDFSEDTCRFFVNGLQFSLAAYGAVLWSAQTAVLRIPLPTPFKSCMRGKAIHLLSQLR